MKKQIEIIEEEIVGTLGQPIKPGDEVVTFTQVYGRGTRVAKGRFLGVTKIDRGWGMDTGYWVARGDGSRTKLHYPGMVLLGTKLEDLDNRVI